MSDSLRTCHLVRIVRCVMARDPAVPNRFGGRPNAMRDFPRLKEVSRAYFLPCLAIIPVFLYAFLEARKAFKFLKRTTRSSAAAVGRSVDVMLQ